MALPEVSPIINLFSFPGSHHGDFDSTIKSLLLGYDSHNPFAAQAETFVTEGTPQQLLDSPGALLEMLDKQGLDRRFSGSPDYSDAAQCKGNYQREGDVWQDRNFTDFTSVKRPASDTNCSIMVAGKIRAGTHLVEAEGATQYKGHSAIALSGNDPGTLLAGWSLIKQFYPVSSKEATQGLTPIEKRSVTVSEGQSALRFETPVSALIHVPRPPRNSRFGRRSGGVVFAHNKKDRENSNRIYYTELYV